MRAILAISLMLALSGCGVFRGADTGMPVGIGGGANELRRAPCACMEKKQKPGLPEFLQDGDRKGEGVAA